MIASKHIARIVVVMICICLLVCGFIVYAANTFDTTTIPEYQKRLFSDEIISLDIKADDGDWQDLLDNAQAKEWISATVVINGETFSAVGIRTKGNSSLSQNTGDRYSLQIKFNYYVKGQTYYGLDAFCINNMMGDATYMKEYISYDIMNYIGVDTPLTNYADVTVNGEGYGFFLALERYDEAFLDRVYNTSAGELYNVKISMGGRGDFEDRWEDTENSFPGRRQTGDNSGENTALPGNTQGEAPVSPPEGDINEFEQDGMSDSPQSNIFDFSQMGGNNVMGFGGGSGGGSLVYTSDDPEDYSAIFDNVVTGTASEKDMQRVITAIKNLNEGTNLEEYFDVDGILRYFAAHTVVVNLDSYISNMQQNYYIYENDGKISILPWDYSLAFGGFQSGSASSVVNFPIDTPVSGVSMEDRPLLNMLLEVDEYRERYHQYLNEIVEGYFESGLFEDTVNAIDEKISEYVKNDASAFFTYEEYEAALPELIKLGSLRAESIRGQLDGNIPSTSSGQNADSSALVDSSGVNLSALGSMMGGMGQAGFDGQGPNMPDGNFSIPGGETLDMEQMQRAMEILTAAGWEFTDEVKADLMELGISEEIIDSFSNMMDGGMMGGGMFGGMGQGGGGGNAFPGGTDESAQENRQNGGNFPLENTQLGDGISMQSGTGVNSTANIIIVGVLLLFLAGAIVFVARPRKNTV